jgi:hypothetical protein
MVGVAILAAGCQTTPGRGSSRAVTDLDRRYERIVQRIEPFKEGGRIVLDVAYSTLREGKAEGKWDRVGLEDLWAEAIKEGGVLFNQPERRWGKTTAEETRDMIGQTTIGPWQITVTNVKNKYGLPYGVKPDWSNNEVNDYIRQHPEIQVKMISDYIQEAYSDYGKRSPYGIQRYFWLEAYVRGWIGQGEWDKSVLPTAPDGDWRKLTPEMKADTGFYAKQLVCGNSHNPYGLLYWLWVSGNTEGMRDLLRTWRDQKLMTWDEENGKAVLTDEPGNFAIHPEDLKYMEQFPEAHAEVARIVKEVLAEKAGS